MAYTINKTTGEILITLLDGTADGPSINPGASVSDIDLFGKNYPLYGDKLDENFVRLLQNFAGATQPAKPLQGELWYDTGTGFLKVYTGTTFTPVTPVLVSNTAPTTTAVGAQWWDQTNRQSYSWNGTAWTLVGPGYKYTDGKSGAIVETVADTIGGTHTVTKFYQQDNVVAISSYDAAFTLSPSNPVVGFSTIAPGITLATGVANEYIFVGAASNSKMLGNVLAANYARTDIIPTFTSNILVAGGNIAIDSAPNGTARYYNNVINANVSVWANVGGTPTAALRVVGTDASTKIYGDFAIQNNKSLTVYGVTSTGATGTGQLVFSANPTFTGTISAGTISASNILNSSLTSGRVVYSSAGGAEVDSAQLTFDGATLTAGNLTVTNNTTVGTLSATGHVTLEGVTSTGATGTGQLVFSTNPTLSAALTVTNGITFNGTLTSSNNLNFNSGKLTVNGTTGDVVTSRNLQIGGTLNVHGTTSAGTTGTGKIVFDQSPTLTGTPLAQTPTSGDSSTKIATTAFVSDAIATSTSGLWKGSNKFVSSSSPNPAYGNVGDFWFQI